MRQTQPRRRGFTITELLVAMALIVFIMYVLAEAFSAGAGAFRKLKAIGDMNEQLRSASTIMRKYLGADHFEGKKRLSDPDFWQDGPPKEGFFRIYQGTKGTLEGVDLDGLESWCATDHMLHFSVKLRGNNRGEFFRANLPGSPLLALPGADSRFQEGNDLCSPWGEVCFYLRDTGETTKDPENPGVNDQPLYTLYLRQRLILQDNDLITQAMGNTRVPYANWNQYLELSCYQDPLNTNALYYNSPADVTMPPRRFGQLNGLSSANYSHPPLPQASIPTLNDENTSVGGSDQLLTNVLSMEIRVLLDRTAYASDPLVDFKSLFDPEVTQYAMGNTQFGTAKVFDTWSKMKDDRFDYSVWNNTALPAPDRLIPLYQNSTGKQIRIRAIQITLRIWDVNTKQTRQTSIVQDL